MAKTFDNFSTRMKSYEKENHYIFKSKNPVILRLDGKSFHTFTRGLKRPFDIDLYQCLEYATIELMKESDNAKIAYLQSDEISILLTDTDNDSTQPWFKYSKQKLESISASIFTYYFNDAFKRLFPETDKVAFFDCRAFSVPFTEVNNVFYWRQQDCIKNSVTMVASMYYSHKQLNDKSTRDRVQLLKDKNVDFYSDVDIQFQRGRCIYKQDSGFVVDRNIPIFKDDRNYINKYINNYFPDELKQVLYKIYNDDKSINMDYLNEINQIIQVEDKEKFNKYISNNFPDIDISDRHLQKKLQQEYSFLKVVDNSY